MFQARLDEIINLRHELVLLKQIYGLSDEAACERWMNVPYFQYFTSESVFRHALPRKRSLMPAAFAILSTVECIISPGGSRSVSGRHARSHFGAEWRNVRRPHFVEQEALEAVLGKALLPTPQCQCRVNTPQKCRPKSPHFR